MKIRLAKKIMTTPLNRLNPYWRRAAIIGDDRIEKAKRIIMRKV